MACQDHVSYHMKTAQEFPGWHLTPRLRPVLPPLYHERLHQALGYRTPAAVHAGSVRWKTQARVTEAE